MAKMNIIAIIIFPPTFKYQIQVNKRRKHQK
jgi:hypothetical protein